MPHPGESESDAGPPGSLSPAYRPPSRVGVTSRGLRCLRPPRQAMIVMIRVCLGWKKKQSRRPVSVSGAALTVRRSHRRGPTAHGDGDESSAGPGVATPIVCWESFFVSPQQHNAGVAAKRICCSAMYVGTDWPSKIAQNVRIQLFSQKCF